MMGPRTAVLFMVLLALCSCSRPSGSEQFILSDDAEYGVYSFELDLSDSLCTYDVSFYSRVDSPLFSAPVALPLDVRWISPSGETYDETVCMRGVGRNGAREMYRTGIDPSEHGIWTLTLTPEDVPDGFRGLGVICSMMKD